MVHGVPGSVAVDLPRRALELLTDARRRNHRGTVRNDYRHFNFASPRFPITRARCLRATSRIFVLTVVERRRDHRETLPDGDKGESVNLRVREYLGLPEACGRVEGSLNQMNWICCVCMFFYSCGIHRVEVDSPRLSSSFTHR